MIYQLGFILKISPKVLAVSGYHVIFQDVNLLKKFKGIKEFPFSNSRD